MDRLTHMQALTGERLLTACECAQAEPPLLRPLTLLAAAMLDQDRRELMDVPVSERDRLLLHMRRISFGPVLEGYATCRLCASAMEFRLSVDDALQGLENTGDALSAQWQDQGVDFQLRQATTADLVASASMPTAELAAQHLLARCLGFDELPQAAPQCTALPSVRSHFDRLHAVSELRCTLCCPQCAHADTWDLDVGHFVWIEARRAARRLLSDIHTLALHYGWSEPAIVGMSQQRRDAYLELLCA
jgi:hypothetical protein